jgi:hypothetical protein
MQQHWLTDKKQICNFKHTEEKLVTRWKTKKFSLLWRRLKLKQKQNNSKDFVFLFPRLVPFLGLVHFLYCTYCVHTMWNKSFMKMLTWGSPISWNFSGSFGPKVSRFAGSWSKFCDLGCWIKSTMLITSAAVPLSASGSWIKIHRNHHCELVGVTSHPWLVLLSALSLVNRCAAYYLSLLCWMA